MKTFLALAEGFDHLAAIVRKEGDKGPITKDCLAILRNVVSVAILRNVDQFK
jgi:hypothetical protein